MDKKKSKNIWRNHVLVFNKLVYSILLSSSLLACQSTSITPQQPSWLLATPTNNTSIFSVGSAPVFQDQAKAQQAATESARIEIAKKINVVIESNTFVEQHANNGVSTLRFKETINNRVPSIELAGVNIVESYIDQKNQIVYVLAEFNKQQAIINLSEKIDFLDLDMEGIDIDLNNNTVTKLKQAVKVQTLFSQREKLTKQLSQLGSENNLLSRHQQTLLHKVNAVFTNLTFAIAHSNNDVSKHNTQLAKQLTQALSLQGLTIAEPALFQLNYDIQWRQIHRDSTYYIFAEANIDVIAEQKTFKSFIAKAKGVSSDEQLAKNKAIDKLANELVKRINNELLK
jgi:hypothetical protein